MDVLTIIKRVKDGSRNKVTAYYWLMKRDVGNNNNNN